MNSEKKRIKNLERKLKRMKETHQINLNKALMRHRRKKVMKENLLYKKEIAELKETVNRLNMLL